jgi:hypothetical protein
MTGYVYDELNRRTRTNFDINYETLKSIVEEGRNHEDFPPYTIIEKLGYSGMFVSEHFSRRDEGRALSFLCGAYAEPLQNSCLLRIPKFGEIRDRLLQRDTILCVLKNLVSAWEPDTAIVKSRGPIIRQPSGEVTTVKSPIGWMNYFATPLGNCPTICPRMTESK